MSEKSIPATRSGVVDDLLDVPGRLASLLIAVGLMGGVDASVPEGVLGGHGVGLVQVVAELPSGAMRFQVLTVDVNVRGVTQSLEEVPTAVDGQGRRRDLVLIAHRPEAVVG